MAMSEIEWIDIFGDNLVDMLKDARMTQKELAEESRVSNATISNYIHKKQMPNTRALVNIAYALNCSLNDLMDFGDDIE